MKRLLFVVITVYGMTSCTTVANLNSPRSPLITSASYVDYEPYVDRGFFISESNSVSFEYTPISSLMALSVSGYETIRAEPIKKDNISDDGKKKFKDDVYSLDRPLEGVKLSGNFVQVSPQDVLDELYRKAVEMGANGIINLKVVSSNDFGYNLKGELIPLIGYSASGMAIKK